LATDVIPISQASKFFLTLKRISWREGEKEGRKERREGENRGRKKERTERSTW
jgi:hypothetical protein